MIFSGAVNILLSDGDGFSDVRFGNGVHDGVHSGTVSIIVIDCYLGDAAEPASVIGDDDFDHSSFNDGKSGRTILLQLVAVIYTYRGI